MTDILKAALNTPKPKEAHPTKARQAKSKGR